MDRDTEIGQVDEGRQPGHSRCHGYGTRISDSWTFVSGVHMMPCPDYTSGHTL